MGQYSGMALPWDGTLATLVEPKEDIDVLRSSIIWILLTRKRERVMLPTFGSDVPDAVFEPNDIVTEESIRNAVQEAVEEWDDRVEFLGADIEIGEHTITVKVKFQNVEDPLARDIATVEVTVSPENVY